MTREHDHAGTGQQRGPARLDRFFAVADRGSTLGREVRGGVTTFVTMSYIVLLNPLILGRCTCLGPSTTSPQPKPRSPQTPRPHQRLHLPVHATTAPMRPTTTRCRWPTGTTPTGTPPENYSEALPPPWVCGRSLPGNSSTSTAEPPPPQRPRATARPASLPPKSPAAPTAAAIRADTAPPTTQRPQQCFLDRAQTVAVPALITRFQAGNRNGQATHARRWHPRVRHSLGRARVGPAHVVCRAVFSERVNPRMRPWCGHSEGTSALGTRVARHAPRYSASLP